MNIGDNIDLSMSFNNDDDHIELRISCSLETFEVFVPYQNKKQL